MIFIDVLGKNFQPRCAGDMFVFFVLNLLALFCFGVLYGRTLVIELFGIFFHWYPKEWICIEFSFDSQLEQLVTVRMPQRP